MSAAGDCSERRGVVIACAEGRAQVRLESAPGCCACASRRACGSSAAGAQLIEIELPSARTGDAVTLAIPSATLGAAAVLGYLLPPVCLLAGAIVADRAWASDAAAVFGAVVGLIGGLLVARVCGEGDSDFARRLAPVPLSSHAQRTIAPRPFEPGDMP